MAIKITSAQSRRINTLIRKLCCNCYDGNCLLLDDGEAHACVQLISRYGIYCNYFKTAVLPADKELYAEVMNKPYGKACVLCSDAFYPKRKTNVSVLNAQSDKSETEQRSDNAENGHRRHAFKALNAACFKGFREQKSGREYPNTFPLENGVNKRDRARRISFTSNIFVRHPIFGFLNFRKTDGSKTERVRYILPAEKEQYLEIGETR